MAIDPDYDSDSAVEQILSEAMDHHVLQQISSINLSGVSNDSLPTDLETRFRKLKSFPAPTNPKLVNSQINDIPTSSNPSETTPIPISSPIWDEIDLKPNPKHGHGNGHVSSPSLSSSSSSSEGPSTPPQAMCFWCSPKTKKKKSKSKSKKKSKKNNGVVHGDDDDAVDLDLFLSDLSKFSGKEGNRSLKKALKEQEKISREAEKMVDFAKQLSSRFDDYVIPHHDLK